MVLRPACLPYSLCLAALIGCTERSAVRERPSPSVRGGPSFTIRGKGATFPAAAYAQWALASMERGGANVQYSAAGSQAGVAAIKEGTVDFGASDIPLSGAEQQRLGLVQVPVVIGGVAVVLNLPGVAPGQLRLTAAVLEDIYGGAIRRWNDPPLTELNPGLELPAREIIPIRRDEDSGTAQLFARFLASARPAAGPAANGAIPGVVARSNAQAADFVRRFKYTIAYTEISYIRSHALAWALLRNTAGRYVKPTPRAVESAAEHGTWGGATGLEAQLTGAPGGESWPIAGASYILVRARPQRPARARRVLDFFHWALTDGAEASRAAGYVPIPHRLVDAIEKTWIERVTARDAPVWSSGRAKE